MKAEEYLKERDINPDRVIKKTKQKSGHGITLKDLLEEYASQSEPSERRLDELAKEHFDNIHYKAAFKKGFKAAIRELNNRL